MLSGGIWMFVTRVVFRQLHSGERKLRNRLFASFLYMHGSPSLTGPPLKMSAGTLNFARFARANGAHYI